MNVKKNKLKIQKLSNLNATGLFQETPAATYISSLDMNNYPIRIIATIGNLHNEIVREYLSNPSLLNQSIEQKWEYISDYISQKGISYKAPFDFQAEFNNFFKKIESNPFSLDLAPIINSSQLIRSGYQECIANKKEVRNAVKTFIQTWISSENDDFSSKLISFENTISNSSNLLKMDKILLIGGSSIARMSHRLWLNEINNPNSDWYEPNLDKSDYMFNTCQGGSDGVFSADAAGWFAGIAGGVYYNLMHPLDPTTFVITTVGAGVVVGTIASVSRWIKNRRTE